MSEVFPTFLERSFLFEGDIPPHIDSYPDTPNFVGLYSVFGAVDGVKPYPLAVDIETPDLAELIARARADKQESDIESYGYSDDVYINSPEGSNRRIYYGRSL